MKRAQPVVLAALVAAGVVASSASTAKAILNEFSVADGYNFPFATSVWTYNPLWNLEGGSIFSNYVAQHGYGSGFPFGEPFGLVIRNDNGGSGNYRFNYSFVSGDLGGVNPANTAGQRISIGFDIRAVFNTNMGGPTAPMLSMAFGGTRAAPAMTLAFSNNNRLMYSDPSNNMVEYAGYTPFGGWDRVTVTLDFASNTYDLQIQSLTGNYMNASNTFVPTNTYNVVTGAPMANAMTSLNNLWFETFTDPGNGMGYGKGFIDHFTGAAAPAPGSAALLSLALLTTTRRRRPA